MGVNNNLTLPGLPEDFIEPDNRHHMRLDDIFKYIAGAYRRQLIDISHQNQGRFRRHGL